jgi:DNA-directed RNA polymerase specialized sigma24 family protein
VPGDVAVELRRVYAIVAQLPAEARVALILRRVDGLDVPEIARRMTLSLSTVKRRLKLAEEILERSR